MTTQRQNPASILFSYLGHNGESGLPLRPEAPSPISPSLELTHNKTAAIAPGIAAIHSASQKGTPEWFICTPSATPDT